MEVNKPPQSKDTPIDKLSLVLSPVLPTDNVNTSEESSLETEDECLVSNIMHNQFSKSSASLAHYKNTFNNNNNNMTKLSKFITSTSDNNFLNHEISKNTRFMNMVDFNNDGKIEHFNKNTINDEIIAKIPNRTSNKRPSQLNRRLTQESTMSNFPFKASKHRSQIFPVVDTDTFISNNAYESVCASSISTLSTAYTLPNSKSESLANPLDNLAHMTGSKNKSDYGSIYPKPDHIGHRINEDDVNFNIVRSMLTGIKVSCESIISNPSKYPNNFVDKYYFDTKGALLGKNIKSFESFGFEFKDYFGSIFLKVRKSFNITNEKYLESLTSKYVLNELNSPGKSGSFFYFSKDYKYIIKTIHRNEHIHLRKHLDTYYRYVKDNPHTMICQYYGLHRVKLPISFKNRIQNRKIYLVVMYNVFPPWIKMDLAYDLKGSKFGRYTNIRDQKNENNTRKDLNWIQENKRLVFNEKEVKIRFLNQLWKDVNLLASMNTMDYSLLVGVHFKNKSPNLKTIDASSLSSNDMKGINNSISNTDVIYFVGIIDCLTDYSIIKKLETIVRSINHKPSTISAIPPYRYALRLYTFIASSIDVKHNNNNNI